MHTLTAIELRDKIKNKELSAKEVALHFLNRIETLDPKISAFLRVSKETALKKADEIDSKIAKGEKVGALAGVPVAVKDNIHIKGEISTCGSKFLKNYVAPFNSTAANLLEKQDAIFIGRTNMDEFAMGSSTENSAYQKTKNPWDLKCTPGGSSGGSSAAVAARLCPIALGSDTGGSIRQPASFCGLVGFKPTYGRVSRFGLVAYGSSLDQIGPLALNVQDAALMMSIIGAPCERDATSLHQSKLEFPKSFRTDLIGLKVGVPWHFLEKLADAPKEAFLKGLEKMQALGAEIVDINLDVLRYSIATYYILATAEASTNLARFDGIRYGVRSPNATTLNEVYELSKEEGFGKEVKRRILMGTYVLSAGYKDAYYKKAQQLRTLIIQQYEKSFTTCDFIAMPTTPFTAFEIGAIHDPLQMYLEDIYTVSSNLAGVPSVSVPNGFINKKPIGIQLIAPQKKDLDLLQYASAFSNKTADIPEGFA